VALAKVTRVYDSATVDLDERTELVRLAEAVARAELVEIRQSIGRWLVVVRDADLERNLRRAGDRLRWDPRNRGDGGLEALHGQRTHLVEIMSDGGFPGSIMRAGLISLWGVPG
jgi:hypothetical protein